MPLNKETKPNQTINRVLSGAPTPDQSGPENNGNEYLLHIPQFPGQEHRHQRV